MDEEALNDAHKLFLETGYKGDLAKFKNLISTNPDALKDAHQLFVNTGYSKSIDDFSTLVGVKKKVASTSTTPNQKLVSGQKTGSSGTPKSVDDILALKPKSQKDKAFSELHKNTIPSKNIPKGTKFRIVTDDDLEVSRQKGETAPKSELKYRKVQNPDDLYNLNSDGTPKENSKSLTQSHWNDFTIKKNAQATQKELDPQKTAFDEMMSRSGVDPNKKPEQKNYRLPKGYGKEVTKEESDKFTLDWKASEMKKIDDEIDDNDLDLQHPYLYYSSYGEKPAVKDNFIERVYGSEKLISLGINLVDFNGFLNKKGYKKEFLDKEEKGLFEEKFTNEHNTALAKEMQKKRLLNLYMGEMDGRELSKLKLQIKKEKLNKTTNFSNEHEEEENLAQFTIFDSEKYKSYLESDMPNLSKITREIEEKNRKIYEQHKSGEANILYGTEKVFTKIGYGFLDKVNQIATTITEKIGAEGKAQQMRFLNEERQLSRPNTREVGYAKGLSTKVGETNYLYTKDGRVIDQDLKIDVTDLLQKFEYDNIKSSATSQNKSDWTFSPQGSVIQFGGVAGDLIVQLALSKGVGKAIPSLAKIPLTKSMTAPIIVQSSLGYTQGANETYKIALENGISEKDAQLLANEAGVQMGLLYAVTAPLSPQTKATQAIFGAEGKEAIKKAVLSYAQTGKVGFLQNLKSGLAKIPRASVDWLEEGLVKEGSQELIQQKGETSIVNANINQKAGQDLLNDEMSAEDVVNTLIQTTLSGGMAVVPNLFSKTDKLQTLSNLSKDSNFELNINNLVSNGVVTEQQANVLKKDVKIFSNQINNIPKNLDKEIAMSVMTNLEEISNLEQKKKGLDKAFHEDIDSEIELKRNEIKQQIKSKDAKTEIPITETKSKTEVQKQSEAEKVAEFPLLEGETLVESKQDNKGRTFNTVAVTTEKEGLKKTKFLFNRSDKPSDQRNLTGINPEKLSSDYGFEISKDDIPEGTEVTRVKEIRETNKGSGATVVLKNIENGESWEAEIVITKNKPKEVSPINEVVNEPQEERNIDANGYVPIGDNADLQQREQQPEIIEVQSTADVGESKQNVEVVKPNQARVKSIKGGSYIVDFDENKNVTKIVSAKTGKEIKQFVEVETTGKFGRKKTIVKQNANYKSIEADALGVKPDSTLKAERKNKLKDALTRVEPVDSETAVAEFLASGGKVSYEDVGNGKSAKTMTRLSRKEVQWAIDDNARSLEDVATQISSEYGLDSQDVSNELSRIIASRTKEQVEDFIIDQVEFNNPTQEDINNALAKLSDEQRSEFEAILANEEFLKGLSPIDQAIYFGEKLNEQEQFNINQNGTSTKESKQGEAVVGEPKKQAIQGLDDNGKSPSNSPSEALQEVKKSKLDEIFNQDNIQDGLDWLDNLMLDPNDLKVTLPFLPQTWNAFIQAIKLAYKAGNSMSKAIQEGIKALEALGVSSTEIDSIVNYFNSQNTKTPPKTKKRKPIDKNEIEKDSFEDLVSKLPFTGNKKDSEGAGTTTKLTEDVVVGDVSYDEIGLLETFAHSNNYINVAVEQFGDEFVDKVLDYIENYQLRPNEIAFAFIALENKLRDFLKTNPKDLTTKKQLDLVRKKRITYMTTIGQAMNAPKLQNLAYYGYDTSEVTDMMFTSKEKNDRKELAKSVEVDIEEIQNQEESFDEFEEEIDEIDSLLRGKRKADVKSQKEEISKDIDKIKEDVRKKLLALKNKGLRSSFDAGITEKLIAISPEIIKLAKLYAKSTKLSTKEIIDSIYDDFKDAVDGLKKKDIIDVLQKDLQKETNKKPKAEKSEEEILQDKLDKRTKQLENRLAELKENKPKDNSGKSTVWNEEISGLQNQIKSLKDLQKETNKKPNYLAIVKKALIDAGFGKEITVNTKKGKEQRTVFDWKKLVGQELSLDNIQKNVEETLLSQGYTQEQIDAISTDLQNQYNNLHADIINKKANEINRRNKKNYNTARNNAYRLAELYNLGLFEDQRNQFDNIFNSLLGTTKLDQETFDTLTEMANGLSKIQKEDIGFFGKKLEKDIIDKINKIVHKYKLKKAPLKFKVADLIDKFLGISTRMILHSMGQVVSNTFSGFSAVVKQGIFNKISGNNSTKKYSSRTNRIANATAIDIALNSGSDYGDVDANLSRNSTVEDFLNGKTDSKTAHGLVSAFFGKIHLNMADSYFKSIITNGKMYQALMLVATDKSNKNRMTKKEARNYITKQLTGENWDNAIAKSIEIVEKVNADNNIVSNKKENIARIAEGMVLSNLLENNVFSAETIESAYKASYTSAGFDLGHESNNLITTGVNKVSIELSKRYEKALQEEKYDSATSDLIIKSFFSNFFKTFVGGGTNWAILTAQSTGIDLISLYKNNQLSKDNKIELDSDEGLKNLTEAIKRKLNARSTNTRMAIGAVISTAMLLTYLGMDEEDEDAIIKKTKKWLNENKWAKPYFSYIAPSSLAILVNAGEKGGKDATKETLKILGIKDPNFEDNAKIAKAIKLAYTGKTDQALVEMNKFIGSKANVPLPWRTFRDIEKVYRGMNGLEEIKPNYKTKDPTNALFVGGFAEWIGLINTKNGGKPEKSEPSKYSKF